MSDPKVRQNGRVPWVAAFVLFIIVEGGFWAVLAACGAQRLVEGLLVIAIAFWVTFLAFAPSSFLAQPWILEDIGVKKVWIARLVCAIASAFFWLLVVLMFAPDWFDRIIRNIIAIF